MRRWAPVCAGVCLVAASVDARAQAPTATPPLTLTSALARALTANPAIVAAQARRAIGAAGVAVAGERLNPEGRFEYDRDVPHQAYSLAVPFELGGKRARRIDVANAEIKTAEAELAQLIAETSNQVRRAYFDRLIAEAKLTVLNDLQTIMTRARDAARDRFEAGSSPRLEVLQAELELAQAQNESTGARGETIAARAKLNALLGMPANADNTISPVDLEPAMTADAATALARSASTELAALDRGIEAQKARVALAKSMQTPDVTPEATYERGFEADAPFQNGWRAAIAMTLPIFTNHKAGVTLEEATLAQLVAERAAAESRITSAVAAAAAVAEAQRQQFLKYRDEILPQAAQVETMADDAYRLGQTGITPYLQALQATRDVRLRALQAQADLQTALADLEQAIGAPVKP